MLVERYEGELGGKMDNGLPDDDSRSVSGSD